MHIIGARQAADLIRSGDRIVTGGFGSCGHPDSLTKAVEERFLETGQPADLKLLFAAGSGDKAGRGLDRLAHSGLLSEAIGGFWGLCPALGALARAGDFNAHNWPQGVISGLFSEIAAKRPGIVTKVGLGTFVDPDLEGGVVRPGETIPLVSKVTLQGQNYLFYPALPIDVALLRGTIADPDGNIGFCEETSFMDALAQATAVRNSGGIVIVQVRRLAGKGGVRSADVKIPGDLVDYVVVADAADHPQTYGHALNQAFLTQAEGVLSVPEASTVSIRSMIADRAALELPSGGTARVNLGIGIPALVGERALARKIGGFSVSVESGQLGGVPASGLSFGASSGRSAVIEQSALFDLYDGGWIDIAFLGFGQVDRHGRVNVSRLGDRFPGAGGFINISQAARHIVFCGTLTTGGLEAIKTDTSLTVLRNGNIAKFVPVVEQVTFDPVYSAARSIVFITERCVFHFNHGHFVLTEIAPGVTVADLEAVIPFEFAVSTTLKTYRTFADLAAAA